MPFNKPNVNQLWASNGSIVAPSNAKQQQGWISEIPPFEFENWLQNKQDQYIAHSNQYGIPVWDSITEYIANKSYVQGSNGIVYRAIQTHTNQNPVTDATNTYWVVAFSTYQVSYTKAESDNLYLRKANNLSDVSSISSARSNLNVYSKTEVYTKTEVNSLLDPVGKVIMFAGSGEPSGYLNCDGRAVSRTLYATLFGVIGTTFGTGDGSTTFNIPNLENDFVRGASSTRNVGTRESDELRSHTHTGNTNTSGNHRHSDIGQGIGDADGSPGGQGYSGSHLTGEAGNHSHSFVTNATGGSETRPRNVALRFCIKY